MLAHATATERFTVRDGDVVVDPSVGSLAPLPEHPATELSGAVRATLEEFETDPLAEERLATVLDALSPRARGLVLLAFAWRAHRAGEAALAFDRVRALCETLAAGEPFRQVAAGSAVLCATRREPVPSLAIEVLARGEPEFAHAVAERLRELGDAGASSALGARTDDVTASRATLARARTVLGILTAATTTSPIVFAVGDRILHFVPDGQGGGEGALVEPLPFVARLRAANALAAPWSGTPTTSGAPDAVDVVPGVFAIDPERRVTSRTGPLGLLLVLLACAIAFVGGLRAVRAGIVREREAIFVRSEFLTTVTHELRTPIAAIRLLAERLDEGQVTDAARRDEYHAMLAREAARLSVLVENVLDLGRIERGERAYDRRDVPVGELIADAGHSFEALAHRAGLAFTIDDKSEAAGVSVDRAAIRQALLNLCDNALKYGAAGGVIALSAEREDGGVVIAVRDRGPGVPPADRERIFRRFVRGSAHAHGSVPGVGLGLHLARHIALAHGGTLGYEEPKDGVGACFALRLPYAPRTDATDPR
ncbi:MAG: HAMP domain-containing histidine kinase [Planctomycetes bacterium]|nr:HAMP domain-containing histidine kinase [Planctomycetota bacterium]